jgi:hypothetical protein
MDTLIHSVTDISHEFTFYFDERFTNTYVETDKTWQARNWGTLHKCDLRNANLLILQSGATACPYTHADIAAVSQFLAEGGGVAVLGDYCTFRGESAYRLNELIQPFDATFVQDRAVQPLVAAHELNVPAVFTFGGGTLVAGPEWRVLVRDQNRSPVMIHRRVGPGSMLVCSRALAGQDPDAPEPVNQELWRNLLVDISRGKPVTPGHGPSAQFSDNVENRDGIQVRFSDYLQPSADAVFGVWSRTRPVLIQLMGIEPSPGMIENLILIATAGGGFSGGRDIAVGAWWGGFPDEKYGMIELLSHEATHSWVLPHSEPMWNEGIATYVGIQAGSVLGCESESKSTLAGWIEAARRLDPEFTRFDLASEGPGNDVPHDVRMGKSM